jgi:Na+-transporting NADH:ubiquinone oxidoreductase subunit NqrB
MLFFPIIAVLCAYISIFLPAFFASHVFYGNIEHMFAFVRRNITAVSIGLFLKIIMYLPNHFILHNGCKSGYAWEIGWMK